jgi:hypothetical protein
MEDPSFEEMQRILNDDDIERLTRGILRTLKDMSDSGVENDLKLSRIYDRMGLNAYHTKVVDYVCQKYLLPNDLIKLQDDLIQITDKGSNRIKQIEKTDDFIMKTMTIQERHKKNGKLEK